MAESEELQVIGEKTLHHPANPDLLSYCPSMDLLAVGSTDQNVIIYRLNGQRVFGAGQKGKGAVLDVQKLGWKPNGQLLAIAWSDGTVRLLGAESNKTVHQISVSDEDDVEITCLAWVPNSTATKALGSILAQAGPLWNDVLSDGKKENVAQPLDLPRDLASIDIESSMPKLSTLPSGGTTEDIFSSRASLDSLFRPFNPEDSDSVDVMVVGTSDGHIHLSIYDSFVVGSFPSPLKSSKTSSHQLVLHTSHKRYSVHGLLMKSTSTLVGGLYFVPMDLRFITASSSYLSLLASRSTALQNLLRYINQVQTLMAAEWQASQDLPGRFLGNIDETLAEHGGWTIAPALYHQVVTGHTLPEVKEWLVDELAERGHKRWDKAVTTALSTLIKLTHEHLLPALERCTLLLSRLHGLATYHAPSSPLGFSPSQIALLLDNIACLNLAASRILTYAVEDLDLFTTFSAWLRAEIDRLASDSAATDPADPDKDQTQPHSKILLYIQTSLTTSRLAPFFADAASDADAALDPASPLFARLATALHAHDAGTGAGATPPTPAVPSVKLLARRLSAHAAAVFAAIAAAEKRNVLFGAPVAVSAPTGTAALAMRMVSVDARRSATYIATAGSEAGAALRVQRVVLATEGGVSSHVSTHAAALSLGGASRVVDLAFLDDETLLVLVCGGGGTTPRRLLAVPFRQSAGVLRFGDGGGPAAPVTEVEEGGGCRGFAIPDAGGFVAAGVRVGGEGSGRRVVVVGEEGGRYVVVGIPVGSRAVEA